MTSSPLLFFGRFLNVLIVFPTKLQAKSIKQCLQGSLEEINSSNNDKQNKTASLAAKSFGA